MSTKNKQSPKKATSKDQLAGVIKRLQAGESTLTAESKRLGYADNTPLRNALRAHLGGKPAYEKMIERAMKAREPKAKKQNKKKATKKVPAPEPHRAAA